MSVSLKQQAHHSPPGRASDEAFIFTNIAENRYREYIYMKSCYIIIKQYINCNVTILIY